MRILVVEDASPIRKSVVQGLREAGYSVDEAADGETALWFAKSNEHDVIVLDLMLPKVDGLAVLKTLRKDRSAAFVLLLTARDAPEDKVAGLELGADDYLAKPFHFPELLARVKALVRRKYEVRGATVTVGDLVVDLRSRIVRRSGELVDLSGKEFALLEYLALNANRIVSRSDIWQHVYDFNASPESNVIDVFIARLRAKIERDGKPPLIHTRRGQGYLLAQTSTGEAP
jgi:DNA-binding response OmpR family regulator